jgi:hypothetical protein
MGDAMGGGASAPRTHAAKVKELTGCVAGKTNRDSSNEQERKKRVVY